MPKHSPHKSACVTTGQDTSSSYVQGGVNHQSAAAGGSTFTHGGQQHPQYSPREYSERHSADKVQIATVQLSVSKKLTFTNAQLIAKLS